MGFNFHVPLPGPFSYSKRVGGSGPPVSEQVEQIRIQGALRDLYCPPHLRLNNGVDWGLTVLLTLFLAIFVGWWALPIGLFAAAVVGGLHRARAQRRAAFGVHRLASGAGCHNCQTESDRAARRGDFRPLSAASGRHRATKEN